MFGQARRDQFLLISGSVAEFLPVLEVTPEYVRVREGDYPRPKLAEYVTDGGRLWIAVADLPARVEAAEVRRLRDSAILGALFGGGDARRGPLQLWVTVWALVAVLALFAFRG